MKKELTKNPEKIAQYRERAKELASQLTLEEKTSQTLYEAAAIDRLGIRSYNWWNEALHGVARAGTATVFPQAIGLAATFDEDFLEKIGDAISTEGRAKYNMQQKYHDAGRYKGLTFWTPNINIFRDPRWGRGHETFGEDPYLTSRMGVRLIFGIQGHDESYLKAAACAKHFAVHSGPEDLRHEFNAEVSEQDLYETYLPAFYACVREGQVEAVMGAYNAVNGEPCCGNHRLLIDILRKDWGFQGHVTSDCWAIKDFHQGHMVTSGPLESVALAMNNGCDLNCGNLFHYLTEAVEKGMVDESRMEEAVTNLFTSRMKLGTMDKEDLTPFRDIPYEIVDSNEMRALNREAASKCVVLLKNDGILPLNASKLKTIGVIGPNADNRKALVGNYEGTSSEYVTILDGIRAAVGENTRILYSEGCHLFKEIIPRTDRRSEVQAVCAASDVVICCLGLDAGLEGEEGDQGNEFASGDKPNLNLPGSQLEILKLAYASGKPVVLILLSGSALAIPWAQEHVSAILTGWYPGAQGGNGIADILFGKKSPEGRLPVTFYKTTEELPSFTDYSMKGRTYRYMEQDALYPFGYGLSYTDFSYSDIGLSAMTLTENGVTVSGTLTNTGAMDGAETVQVYIKAKREGTPNAQLKGLKKYFLKAGECTSFSINLPLSAFGLCDETGTKKVLPGTYEIFVGGTQPDRRSMELTGKSIWHTEIFSDMEAEVALM
ncbi:MAG: glycoside hydrolase family 3 C-terminal domain-containing protein [bacterium]|nr:glycoside hydrolase family 3 C-terminal domain-containing protein [bacterium]